MAEQRQENNKRTKRKIEIWGRRSLPCTMRQTTRSRIQDGYLCPCPAAMNTHSLSPVNRKLDSLGQEGSKVAWSGCSRSLVLEKGLPEFADFRLVCVCFNGRNVRKALCELKTPRRRGQHLRRWNQRQREQFYQTSAESLEVAFTLCSFLRKKSKKSNFLLPCTKWSW